MEALPARLTWRKSSYSSPNGSDCVELADAHPAVAVRDSKNPETAHLSFSRRQFTRFAQSIKHS